MYRIHENLFKFNDPKVLDSDMSVGGVTVDPDDELGCCSINLGEIDGDNLETWLDLKNIEHGRLKIRVERFHPEPVSEDQQATKSDDSIQMMQVWIRSVDGIFNIKLHRV